MIRPIVKYPDPILRRKSSPVGINTNDLDKLIADMWDTLYDSRGYALAAVQVGVPLRLVIADVFPASPEVLIDPKVIELCGEPVEVDEGCLSIPGYQERVKRYPAVMIKYTGTNGLNGFIDTALDPGTDEQRRLRAQVLQHEVDHLEGVLFIERLSPVDRERIKRALRGAKR